MPWKGLRNDRVTQARLASQAEGALRTTEAKEAASGMPATAGTMDAANSPTALPPSANTSPSWKIAA